MADLEGKVAIVTGAGSGIGREAALRFAREGACVAIVDVDGDAGRQVEVTIAHEHGTARAVQCDVSQAPEVEAMVAGVMREFGRLDVLVNSAGVSLGKGRTGEFELEAWHRSIAVNLTGSFLTSRYAIPAMSQSGGGSIVNIGSVFGLAGMPGDVAYAASKGGVIQLTRTAALEYARLGVRVNCICPGFVETPLVSGPLIERGALDVMASITAPMGRLAKPAEVVELLLFLASDRASFITGAIIPIDGGKTAR